MKKKTTKNKAFEHKNDMCLYEHVRLWKIATSWCQWIKWATKENFHGIVHTTHTPHIPNFIPILSLFYDGGGWCLVFVYCTKNSIWKCGIGSLFVCHFCLAYENFEYLFSLVWLRYIHLLAKYFSSFMCIVDSFIQRSECLS